MPEHDTESYDNKNRKMVISSDATETMIDRLGKPPYNLSRSACFRIGVKMLHDYVIEDRLPEEGHKGEESSPV